MQTKFIAYLCIELAWSRLFTLKLVLLECLSLWIECTIDRISMIVIPFIMKALLIVISYWNNTADPDANAITAGPSGETESLGGDVIESNNQNNRETASEPGDLNSSGQNNQAFETEENVVVVDETNAVNVKRKCYCKNILIVSASNYWHLMVIFREQERRSFFRSSSRNANSRWRRKSR